MYLRTSSLTHLIPSLAYSPYIPPKPSLPPSFFLLPSSSFLFESIQHTIWLLSYDHSQCLKQVLSLLTCDVAYMISRDPHPPKPSFPPSSFLIPVYSRVVAVDSSKWRAPGRLSVCMGLGVHTLATMAGRVGFDTVRSVRMRTSSAWLYRPCDVDGAEWRGPTSSGAADWADRPGRLLVL